jgi:hypothetical protein
MFSLEADFTDQDIERWINEDVDAWLNELADKLLAKGKELVDKARAKTAAEHGFNNITWNLRSSIGCAVVKDHAIDPARIYFPPIGKGDGGHKTGISYIKEIALLVDGDEIQLIFVAGMEYASLVQAKGKDVIYNVIGDNLAKALKSIE